MKRIFLLKGLDDSLLRSVGGFCPTSKKFADIRRVLFNNLPSELETVFARFDSVGYLDEDIESLLGADGDCTTIENQMKILMQ